jgi:hypothetical protein
LAALFHSNSPRPAAATAEWHHPLCSKPVGGYSRNPLPHKVAGIFLNYVDYRHTRFFARPSTDAPTDGTLGLVPGGYRYMVDHCNGLLLYSNGYPIKLTVVNPATRQWEHLPQILADNHEAYLA